MAENYATMSIQDYISTALPEQLADRSFDVSAGLEDASYATQYIVDGTQYAVRVTNGNQTEVVPGNVDDPLVTISMDEPTWRDAIQDNVPSAAAMVAPDTMTKSRLEKLRGMKGTFNLELTKEDGEIARSTTIFNSTEAPEVTLMMKAEDYARILRGELNSQMAFMTGKLKFKGDMNFLMKLGSLM